MADSAKTTPENEDKEAELSPPDLMLKLPEEEKFLYKKKGFYIALQNPDDHKEIFKKAVAELETELGRQRTNSLKIYDEKKGLVLDWINRLKNRLAEIISRREHYEVYMRGQEKRKTELEEAVKKLSDDLFAAISELGQKKSSVVNTQLESIEKEIAKVVEIYEKLENDYNQKAVQRHQTDTKSTEKKIAFWESILRDLRTEYEKVLERIKNLSQDGVNIQNARFLIGLGWLSAFIAGWFFSVWAGKAGDPANGNLTGNSSVRFFFIDHIGQYLSAFKWFEVLAGVIGYIAIMGGVSYLCYYLLKHYQKRSGRKNKFQKDPQLSFDSGEENLLSFKVKADNWWTFWIKISPFIIFIAPLLAIITNEVNQLKRAAVNSSGNTAGEFETLQGLFDGMVNQLIGMFIAVSLTTFMIMYLSRVSEHSYHNRGHQARSWIFRRIKIYHLGFICFGLTVLSMVLFKFSLPILEDVRRVALFGFATSSLAAAFGLGYGYIFKGLQENAGSLLYHQQAITMHIDNLSKPDRISYTGNLLFLDRVDKLQQKMFELIETRHKLATKVNTGRAPAKVTLAPVIVQQQKPDKKKSFFVRFLQIVPPIYRKKKIDTEEELADADRHFESAFSLTDGEVFYFAEQSQKIEALSDRIREHRSTIRKIEQEIRSYWRNEETYQSLNDQVKNVEKRIQHREHELKKVDEYREAAQNNLLLLNEERKIWLNEGYFTGLWFTRNRRHVIDEEKLLGPSQSNTDNGK